MPGRPSCWMPASTRPRTHSVTGRSLSTDPRILYAYHMYEPWAATSAPNMKREIPYRYPGDAPFGERTEHWDPARVLNYLQQPIEWARKHQVPSQPHGGRRIRLRAPMAGLSAVSRGRDHRPRGRRRPLGVLLLSRRLGWVRLRTRRRQAALAVLGSPGEGQALRIAARAESRVRSDPATSETGARAESRLNFAIRETFRH